MLRASFRDAYEASKLLSRTTSVVDRGLARDLNCNRRQASEVIGAFLCKLSYPKEKDLESLFNCLIREIRTEDGKCRM